VRAELLFTGREAALTAADFSGRYYARRLKVSPRIGRADRFINLPDGGQFQCADHPFLASLPQESRSEGPVAWLEERWGVALAGVAVIAAILLSGYFYGLPAAAEHLAAKIPVETEQALGREAIVWMDSNKWFKPTSLAGNKQKDIREGFEGLLENLPLGAYYHLEFRDSSFIGPNAFALPGGTIVITDDMVNAAESREEVLAVLAHEIGHVELRHTMRSVLQNSAIAVVAATVTADAASLSAAVSGLPALLAQTKYSREFESEADAYAFRLLRQKNYPPAAFASLMERLAKKYENTEHALDFVSTHPSTAERVKRARASDTKR
jgi:hypothetical protein